jgi:hypothetical protein
VSHESFLSAGLRHVRDAERLLTSSPDQAWHLGGFALECARKAYLVDGWVARVLGHDFSSASELTLDAASALDPRLSRYPLRDWATRFPDVARWNPEHRYERTGTCAAETRDVAALVQHARDAVDRCLLDLALEGALDGKDLDV